MAIVDSIQLAAKILKAHLKYQPNRQLKNQK